MTWRPIITITVCGTPKGQPRARAFARKMGGKFVARVYDAGTAEGWKGAIALAAQQHRPASPLEGPIRVDGIYRFPRPKRLCHKRDPEGLIPHTAKPDRDNLDKATLDALTQLGIWRDDAQVCDGQVKKFYCEKSGNPGAWIRISVPAKEETA